MASPDHDELSPLLDDPTDRAQRPTSKRFFTWVIIILAALVVAFDLPGNIIIPPRTRLFEIIYCREYYEEHNPSLIGDGGVVDEKFCKIGSVQSKIAFLEGWLGFFDYAPGVFLAVPFGMLADRYGRKWLMVMNAVSTFARCLWMYIVCAFPATFHIKLVWLEAIGGIFGGGFLVATALLFVVVSDVTPASQRITIFFRLGTANMACNLLAPPITASLMKLDPWIPMTLGVGSTALTIPIALALPETLGTVRYEPDDGPSQGLQEDHTNDGAQQAQRSPSIDLSKGGFVFIIRTLSRFLVDLKFLFKDWRILFLMTLYPGYIAANASDALLLKYVSKRFGWTFDQVTYIYSLMATMSIISLLIVFPAASNYLQNRKGFSVARKDILLARISFTIMTVGMFVEAFAPHVSLLIIGVVVATFGLGGAAMIRSFLTSLVKHNEVGRLYTAISIVQTVGMMLGPPILAGLFNKGMERGNGRGVWLGLPYFFLATVIMISTISLWVVRLDDQPEKDITDDERMAEGLGVAEEIPGGQTGAPIDLEGEVYQDSPMYNRRRNS